MLMRKPKSIQIIVSLSMSLLMVSLLVYGKHQRERPYRELEALQKQVNALANGAFLYTEAHHEHLPSAGRWKEELAPYIERKYLQDTGRVAMNRALSGRPLEEIAIPNEAILFFESSRGPSAEVDAIPQRSDAGAFAVCFADGHGYPRGFSERERLIQRSKEVTRQVQKPAPED